MLKLLEHTLGKFAKCGASAQNVELIIDIYIYVYVYIASSDFSLSSWSALCPTHGSIKTVRWSQRWVEI